MKRIKIKVIKSALYSALILLTISSVNAKPFLGIDIGQSTLEPDPNNSGFSITEDKGTGFNVNAGFVFGEKIAAEIRYFDLGSAELTDSANNTKADVSYSGFGIGAAYYYPQYFADWTVYSRLGMSALSTSANVPVEEDSAVSPWLGLGTQVHIGAGMLLHLQYDSYTEDAQQLSLGISKFWGGGEEVDKIEAVEIIDEEAELDLHTSTNKPFSLNPIAGETDTSQTSKNNENTNGNDNSANTETDLLTQALNNELNELGDGLAAQIEREKPKGVFHKSNSIANLYFTIGSSQLTPESQAELQRIQQEYADTKSTQQVIFVGHTCDIGHDGNNEQLSLIRAATAQQYIVSLGIDPEKTKATAFGAKSPKFINNSEENRRENRRVDVFYQVPSLLERLNGLE